MVKWLVFETSAGPEPGARGLGRLVGMGIGRLLTANYLFVFMTAVSTAPFEEPGIMSFPQHVPSSLKGRRANHLPTAAFISVLT